MPINKSEALAQIDAVFKRRRELERDWVAENVQEVITLACSAIERLAPPGSSYVDQKARAFENTLRSVGRSKDEEIERRLQGVLRALRADYEAGCVQAPARSDIPAFLQITKLLDRFHAVAQQLKKRHGGRATLLIEDEYDVQDLLHALLRLEFDDVRPEEPSPSHAGKGARIDFLLKQQRVVIEVKKTRKGLGGKEVGDELLIDIGRYKEHPDCDTLVCFVYDPDGLVDNPTGLKHDLENHSSDAFAVLVHICQH